MFAVKKEGYLRKIYNNSHSCPDIIWEYESLDGYGKGVPYGLDDMIIKYSDFEVMGKTESSNEF